MMSIRTNILIRVYFAFGIIVLIAFCIVGRMAQLQYVEGDKYRAMADSLSTRYANVEAVKGNIYSYDGSLLATSVPEYELHMDMYAGGIETDEVFYEKIDSLAWKLSDYFQDRSSKEYSRLMRDARRDNKRYFLIKRKVSFQDLKAVKQFPIFNMGRYKGGLIPIQKNKRIFPFRSLAARTIGYRNEAGSANVGLEGAYSQFIEGETGKRMMQRIAGGIWMPVNVDDEIAPKDGADIISTIDINMQDMAQSALEKQLIASDADFGCVVLMEVATGEIRAVANYTKQNDGSYKEKYNYAIAQSAEPGSTFKLASYLVALEDEKFDLNDMVDTEHGKYKLFRHTIKDTHDNGVIPMRKAFQVSSNVAIVKQIYRFYKDNPGAFTEKLQGLHLGEPLGLQIPGEGIPLIKTPKSKSWSGLTLPQMAYGYELKITPLQMLMLYNAVANNGKMISPLFVREIRRLGNTIESFKPRVIDENICSEKTLAQLKELLEGVTDSSGTAYDLRSELYKIAGKTGTAQVADGRLGYRSKRQYQVSFCGYFPAAQPKYSMMVMIQNPRKGSYYAAKVAGPVFKEVADKVYAADIQMFSDVKPKQYVGNTHLPFTKNGPKKPTQKVYQALNVKTYFASTNSEISGKIDTNQGVEYKNLHSSIGEVPDVSGMGLKDAIYYLGNAGLKPIVSGSGKVDSQSLQPGAKVKKGSQIMITLN